eukprot:1361219-Rhodomonas_salina.1
MGPPEGAPRLEGGLLEGGPVDGMANTPVSGNTGPGPASLGEGGLARARAACAVSGTCAREGAGLRWAGSGSEGRLSEESWWEPRGEMWAEGGLKRAIVTERGWLSPERGASG